MNSGIKKSFIVRNGKRVPFFKIPTGVSGLTQEGKKNLDTINKPINIEQNKMDEIEEYLETGEINSPEVIDYMSSTHAFSEMELFDKIND